MKKVYSLVLICVIGLSFFAFKPKKETNLQTFEWNDGYPLAAKKKKLLVVDLYTTWCGWCARMDRDTYTDKDIINLLNEDFVFVKVNPERADKMYKIDTMTLSGAKLMNLLTNGKRLGFPTTVVIDPVKNNIVYAESGYQDAATFKKSLEAIKKTKANN
ncbi:MAG: DUF255 domain-containing protein [Sphingobacteriales bacterium]|nr:MAG: DUF255 domain-containing protein [Sphingobacteriales bacterium]